MVDAGILSIIPPIVAIVLALLTKEVVFALLAGVISGTIIYSALAGLSAFGVLTTTVDIMITKFGENANMILFLCFLGVLVVLITRAGGARAYGEWASSKLKSRSSVLFATGILGVFFSIDDYFHCLAVGTIMRPVTDRSKISREKLAYQIDAIGAPLCVIMPISSWAASVISYFPQDGSMSGMQTFIQAIPLNLYAMLSIIMVFFLTFRKKSEFGPMKVADKLAEKGIFSTPEGEATEDDLTKFEKSNANGRVCDLVIPIVVLIISCVLCMLYVGGFFSGEGLNIMEAFGNTVAATALALGAFCALVFTFIYYLCRRVLNFKELFGSISQGVITMVPACIILTFAWTIASVCRDYLGTGEFVAHVVETSGMPVLLLAPMVFIIAALLSFATGTAWGTFGILIPIMITICSVAAPQMTITCLSATLAGSVFGDHCSPISDTTILSSTGSQCNHLKHVGTQIPYAILVAVCCAIGYVIAGITNFMGQGISTVISLAVSVVILISMLFVLPKVWKYTPEQQAIIDSVEE